MLHHYIDVIMSSMAFQITSLTIVYSSVYSGADQRKHQSSASLAFVRGIYRRPVKFPAQRASNAENVSIWWRHHDSICVWFCCDLFCCGWTICTSLALWQPNDFISVNRAALNTQKPRQGIKYMRPSLVVPWFASLYLPYLWLHLKKALPN